MENLSEGHCCDCHCCDCHCCDCHCDGGKTKSTPSLCFRLRLEFDNSLRYLKVFWKAPLTAKYSIFIARYKVIFTFPLSPSVGTQVSYASAGFLGVGVLTIFKCRLQVRTTHYVNPRAGKGHPIVARRDGKVALLLFHK